MRRFVLVNLIVLGLAVLGMEAAARVALFFTRGSSTVGLPERTLYLEYRPFVMFGDDWDTALNPSRYPRAAGDQRKYRILLVGGSTAAGFPTKVLEEAFAQKFKGRRFEVINAAHGGYNARQELIVVSLWGLNLKPDMVISLDGANDLVHRLRMRRAGTFYLDPAYDLALRHPFWAPLAHLLRHSQSVQAVQRLVARQQVGSVEEYQDAIPVYLSAQHGLNVLAQGSSSTRIMVLQPFMGFKQPLSEAERNFKAYAYREAVVKQLYHRMEGGLKNLAQEDQVLYVDGRTAFEGMDQTIFSDDVHFVSEEGYRLLAKQMVRPVTEEMLEKVK